jgi:hypothetical protein
MTLAEPETSSAILRAEPKNAVASIIVIDAPPISLAAQHIGRHTQA